MKFFLLYEEQNDFNKIRFFKTPIHVRVCIALLIIFFVYHFMYICLVIAITFAILANTLKFILLFCKPNLGKNPISKTISLMTKKSDFYVKLEALGLAIEDLKSYSILIPLYMESKITLRNLHNAIEKISYKSELLSIFIICEEDDFKTIDVIKNVFASDKYTILKVPDGQPRTKGRALNYAMQFVKSEYLCIYDAEDLPNADQLLVANYIFKNSSENLAVIQAELEYYNRVNSVSEMMYMDYKYIFAQRNPLMAKLFGFLPLGGTSNHFKVSVIRDVDGWNSYNVTEDAEIALRLFKHGYKMTTMSLKTFEEAVISCDAYIGQRSRWVKGFMQIFFYQFYCIFSKKPSFSSPKIDLFLLGYFFLNIFSMLVFIVVSFRFLFAILEDYFDTYKLDSIFSVTHTWIIYAAFLQFFLRILYDYFSVLTFMNDGRIFGKKSILLYEVSALYLQTASYLKSFIEIIFTPYSWTKTKHFGTFLSKKKKFI